MDDSLLDLIRKAESMRDLLCERIPQIRHYFVDVFHHGLNRNIPFLPIRCFRQFDIFSGELAACQNTRDVFSFVSSGSTNELRGKHYFSEKALAHYAAYSVDGFERFLKRFRIEKSVPIVSLVPEKKEWPTSSLAAMISMFGDAGFDIRYASIEHSLKDLSAILASVNGDCVVFGTSFHHVLVDRIAKRDGVANIFKGKRLAVIDTGGTKGRTEVFSGDEIVQFAKNVYGANAEMMFLSEYGMCELASQAWSLHCPHGNVFACNPTLIPFVVDPSFSRICNVDEQGYLAFGDFVNTDSYPFLVTEDLGRVWNAVHEHDMELGVFSIEGRAPDASLKGCSLNVRQAPELVQRRRQNGLLDFWSAFSFRFERSLPTAFEGNVFGRVRQSLAPAIWTEGDFGDLQETLTCWNEIPRSKFAKYKGCRRGAVAQVVASANIPITWVLPAVAASWMGFREYHINMPTYRADDPFSGSVISRIQDLIAALSHEFEPMKIRLHTRRMVHPDEFSANDLLVFGSDATCKTFKELQPYVNARIQTFGDVWNTSNFRCEFDSVDTLIAACVAWGGRGCLTPIVVYADGCRESRLHLCEQLVEGISAKLKDLGTHTFSRFFHAADTQEICSRLRVLGLNPDEFVFEQSSAKVIDLCEVEKPWEFPLRAGGAGLLFVLDARKKENAELSWLSALNCSPKITDEHMGKTWFEWLT